MGIAGSGSPRVRRHRSLLVRLLLVSLLISLLSIGATAWLAVTSTSRALQQEQSHVLADQAQAYDDLLGYAATHRRWDRVGPLLHDLSTRTGWDLTLTTRDRAPITSTGGGKAPAGQPSAVVDPLNIVPSLDPTVDVGSIDHRAVGPYRITESDQNQLLTLAERSAECARTVTPDKDRATAAVRIATDETGRPRLESRLPTWRRVYEHCRAPALTAPTRTQWEALGKLSEATNRCLDREDLPQVKLDLGFRINYQAEADPDDAPAAQSCVDRARREQLRAHVAPAALLFISSPQAPEQPLVSLSGANIRRIVLVTALVLALTMLLTTLAGLRLVRPLRALIAAVDRPDGTGRAEISSRDEIGRLADAFNELSDRRERLEAQRKAMISDIAHELRTPLSNVRGWLQAAEDNIAARDQALTSSLLEEAVHLQRIIDDLQDLAQADAGELHLYPQELDLAELVALVTQTHRGAADLVGVRIVSQARSGDRVHADATRLRQVIGNLLSNAVRHTPAGGTVEVRATAGAEGVRIDVSDSGGGISAEDLPHVFDRFWRAEKSRGRGGGGSGLGLAIARQLVRAHGGDLTAVSRPGHGSRFTITLSPLPEPDVA
ncbi:sensor histidine kinase [Kineosporia succinea]|uniref:histidine kinase n=1 Tax=Kineosporia succinea TaxID=84632 RepID=A0ABT9PC78_9ACTN|nr:HAMP domain-containing sensor histidine kinase [Kineosporia succinea]MDP9830301.1 two-component system sensor histidine kinase BaeS [Kineosporia succinea]